MRIGLLGVLAAAFLTPSLVGTTAAAADAPPVTAREAYLVDATAGTIQFAKRDTRRVPVASLTKVMTAYVVRKQARLDDVITITKADVRHAATSGATQAGLRAGERLTVRDLLYGLMLPSGADAAHALAERYGPGTPRFVAKMNAAARSLGLADTRYANPDGMPSSAYSTARDQAALAGLALKDPVIATIAKSREQVLRKTGLHRAHVWHNTNKLLGDDGTLGLKTGYTQKAGYCLTFAAVRNGHTFIGVVLGDVSDAGRFATARKLLRWAGDEMSGDDDTADNPAA
ncbi:D-alanyl-D-alanine carboxypeptidase [Planotetraspora sp. A-T 1434]|uniref:D-alanyl-D-alanine carboxypeptidase family protein n=1 Tax=Planotetraspora sp. A-T 1434 TaxID=2979219 RepID=UPI0021BFB10B|nr:D-alanyl-D-alanine carboxypeptidase family protein [Planotetraspora sp. A-T 1434]MCT9930886.1 D-alanyl-D-alanine carboxypeptidase [Planotetraspora sp. A-T 1434]